MPRPVHRIGRFSSLALVGLTTALAIACDRGAAGGASTLTVERDTIGDTVIVRTVTGSQWGDSARLVEELRIGELDGDERYLFGGVAELAVGADGTIYVHDAAVQALRAYDSTGSYLRTIGGQGSGPGEYRQIVGLAVHPDGRLLVRDPALGRIVLYTAAGDPAGQWMAASGLFTSEALRTDTAGRVYSKILTGPIVRNSAWPLGFVQLDANGTVLDTLPAPTWAEELPNTSFYEPNGLWTWHPHGYYVGAFSARYAVELRRPGGPVLRIERAGQPAAPVAAGQRADLEAVLETRRREPDEGGSPPPRPVPQVKPALRAIATGDDGRIWVQPHVESVELTTPIDTTLPPTQRPSRWIEPSVWDVFEPDGVFLGRLELPPKATVFVRRGDQVWGTVRDEDNVPFIVRWRIVTTPLS